MAREKVSIYLDPVVLRRMRVAAARRGLKDSELVEQAVKEYLGMAAWERLQAYQATLPPMTDEEAMALALEVTHEVRAEMRQEREEAERKRD